jgi:type IV secretion system protein VirB9
MKPPILIFFACGLALTATAASASGPGTPEAKHLEPNVPRSITVSENEIPPLVRTALLQSTLIVLPLGEKVVKVFGGDTDSWFFDGGHVPSRFLSIKPKIANTATDVHIVSDHGNEYSLSLREISNDTDPHFDAKVFVAPGDKAAKDRLVELPVFVPAAELDKVKQEAATAQAGQAATLKAEKTQEEAYRSQYPGSLHFDYAWDKSKGKELGLQTIWRDDKFTYLRGQFQETPALYEVKDKKPSLINFDFSNGLYTVPKQLDNGYLAIGKQKVEFHRTQEAR